MRFTRHTALTALILSLLSISSAYSAEPATRPAVQTGERVLQGKVVALDTAAGTLKLSWKHRSMRAMELDLKLEPGVQVTADGKPARVSDVKAGDQISVTGQARGTGDDNRFVVSRIEVGSPAPAKSQPAPAGVDPQVNDILDRLERKKVEDVETPITFTKVDPVLDDKQVFEGILRFKQETPNPRFFIRFDKFTQEGITREKKEWHVFDGQWYIEAREGTQTIVKRQIVRPGEQINVFRIGQGPFPLPFGQSKADILKYFDCKIVPSKPTDSPKIVHLECTPKPGTEMAEKYGSVHFQISKDLDLPVAVRTVEKNENVEVSAEFPPDKIRVNTGLAGSQLNLPELNYNVETVPLPAPEPAGPAK